MGQEHDQNAINIAVLTERVENMKEEIFLRLDQIFEQTKKTNGRVTVIEIALAVIKGKAAIIGILWGTASALVVAFLSIKFIK